ncbi:MAG: nucleotidyltransferase family protein [Halanaerobiales bacterium]|nr:nucleotidyltransferase family protein [Halanaerobiales bacterium]
MEKNLKNLLVSPDTTIKETMAVIDKGVKQIALVVDSSHRLLGTVTDGDIRRAILRGIDLGGPIREAMNNKFKSLPIVTDRKEIEIFLRLGGISQIPLVDEEGIVHELVTLNELIKKEKLDNYIVLMVGGLGSRLYPLTENTPKPLLKVGGRPILETIIRQFNSYGFYNFILCVNYKADQIINYFGDGKKFNVNIEYVRESKRLGTAGALSLITKKIKQPFIVMNGDLLTKLNFKNMIDYHTEGNYAITIGSTEYEFTVPYGVLEVDGQRVENIVEKPKQHFFVNGGFYVLSPSVIKEIPYNEFYDMPDLIQNLLGKKESVGVFPIREFWLDIGQPQDYQRANEEYWTYFLDEEIAVSQETEE